MSGTDRIVDCRGSQAVWCDLIRYLDHMPERGGEDPSSTMPMIDSLSKEFDVVAGAAADPAGQHRWDWFVSVRWYGNNSELLEQMFGPGADYWRCLSALEQAARGDWKWVAGSSPATLVREFRFPGEPVVKITIVCIDLPRGSKRNQGGD